MNKIEKIENGKYWQGLTIMLFGIWELNLGFFDFTNFQKFWNNFVIGSVVLSLGFTISARKQFTH